MRQSITTKYLGPTDRLQGRVKATSTGGHSITLNWDCELDTDANHHAAAKALAVRLNWAGRWVCGAGRIGNVYCVEDNDSFTVSRAE